MRNTGSGGFQAGVDAVRSHQGDVVGEGVPYDELALAGPLQGVHKSKPVDDQARAEPDEWTQKTNNWILSGNTACQ